jgi:hypothetical protein
MVLFCCRWAEGLTLPGELCGSAAVGNECPCCRADASVSLGTLQTSTSPSVGTMCGMLCQPIPRCLQGVCNADDKARHYEPAGAAHKLHHPQGPLAGRWTHNSSSAPHLSCHERELHIRLLVRDARVLCLLRGGLQQPRGVFLPLTAVQHSSVWTAGSQM